MHFIIKFIVVNGLKSIYNKKLINICEKDLEKLKIYFNLDQIKKLLK